MEYGKILKEVSGKLEKNKKIAAAYLFGSYLADPKRARDIDVCLITEGMDGDEMAEIMLKFDKPYDISFMERMPFYVALNVFREGKPVFVNEPEALAKKWREVVHRQLTCGAMRERIFKGVARWMSSPTP